MTYTVSLYSHVNSQVRICGDNEDDFALRERIKWRGSAYLEKRAERPL
jgi:hypothetical protein